MPTTATVDGVTTITLNDGSRLSWGPSTMDGDGNLTEPNGFDWTRYGADDAIEAQDWAETRADMLAVVSAFRDLQFRQGDQVRFELDRKLVDGWYVSQWGLSSSTVTLESPEQWWTDANGRPMPEVYTREDFLIRPVV
jgi:hypothetical protein